MTIHAGASHSSVLKTGAAFNQFAYQQRNIQGALPGKTPGVSFRSTSAPPPDPSVQRMEDWGRRYPVIQTLYKLVDIPSATPQADPRHAQAVEENLAKVRTIINQYLQGVGVTNIRTERDGSMIVRIPGTPGYEKRQPLMLTAHYDIVPADPENPTKPIRRRLVQEGGKDLLTTDGTTTLGADDKGGLAIILDTVARLQGRHPEQNRPMPHVPIEILFSPDEEGSCDSMKTLDFRQFQAKHVLVVDNFYLSIIATGLASSVKVEIDLDVPGGGGHSGVDIGLPNRVNAIMVMADLAKALGTGAITMDPARPGLYSPILSKNIALMRGGTAPNSIPEKASLEISLRSNDQAQQDQELARIRSVVQSFEQQYRQIQPNFRLSMKSQEEYPLWEPDPTSPLPGLASSALQQVGGPPTMSGAFHASAQTNLLAPKINGRGEKFDPILIGPDIRDAHTPRERIDLQSMVTGTQWLTKLVENYTSQST